MPHCLICAAALAAAACVATTSHAAVSTFDDLPAGTAPFLSAYNGLNFGTNDAQSTTWLHSTAASSYYIPHSGAGYAVADLRNYLGDIFEDGQAISSSTPFVLDGAWFSGINQVRFKLYNGSALVYTSLDSPELARTPMFLASGYSGLITSFVVVGRQGYFAMDDLAFATSVPEPASAGLLAAGLLAIAASVLRRTSCAVTPLPIRTS